MMFPAPERRDVCGQRGGIDRPTKGAVFRLIAKSERPSYKLQQGRGIGRNLNAQHLNRQLRETPPHDIETQLALVPEFTVKEDEVTADIPEWRQLVQENDT